MHNSLIISLTFVPISLETKIGEYIIPRSEGD
jgi:hypothetical protein